MENNWDKLADDQALQKTAVALRVSGITALIVSNGQEAKNKVLELLPEGAEVMTMSSVTLDTLGISKEINESEKFNSVKNQLAKMDRKTQSLEMQKVGAAPDWAIGSVHAVTQDGKVVIASNTGSQLPAYVYGAAHVIWVVGAQKVVKNLDEAMKRIYDYVLPLESERLNKAYNLTSGSNPSKILIINREIRPERITLIFVKEKLGF